MAIITLTTDLGTKDFYVSAIKGTIISELSNKVTIVDITNEIPIFDISTAAYTLKNSFNYFPKGSIHIVSVDSEINANTAAILMEYKGHYFIGADNGLFSLIFDYPPDKFYELKINQDTDIMTFPTKNIFVKAACHIARGGTPEIIGTRIKSIKASHKPRPITNNDFIRGSIIHRDSYGNAISNISKRLFEEIGRGRKFVIQFKSYEIKEIYHLYSQANHGGETAAIFNTSGDLEIALYRGVEGSGGGASQLLGLSINETITVEFFNKH